MKKASKVKTRTVAEEMRPEYRFDYSKARPNRFARREKDRVVVALDTDISKVFADSDAVNTALRALIAAMPAGKRKSTKTSMK